MARPLLLSLIVALAQLVNAEARESVTGVCYGLLGDNLPQPQAVVALFKAHKINKIRIYTPDKAVLEALKGSGIKVIVGTLNSDIPVLATSQEAAQSWFATNIKPYIGSVNITYLTVGNEVYPSLPSSDITPAMQNLQSAVDAAGLHGVIKVSTVVSMLVVHNTFPPSLTTFLDPEMVNIVGFLKEQGTNLLVDVYPYFPYSENLDKISLDYATFGTKHVVLHDGELGYTNLFDAMIDSFYWAMEKVGAPNVGLEVTETGWPHGGGDPSVTTIQIAATYNKRLVKHLQSGKGTPKRPNATLHGFIFAMFDENQKPAGVEQFWGIFKPSGQANYNLF